MTAHVRPAMLLWSIALVIVCCDKSDGGTSDSTGCLGECLALDLRARLTSKCPQLEMQVLVGYYPQGKEKAGRYTEENAGNGSVDKCTEQCCNSSDCNYVMMEHTGACFLVSCDSGWEPCLPTKLTDEQLAKNVTSKMVLVRTPLPVTCKPGVVDCKNNEVCNNVDAVSGAGVCECKEGFVKTPTGLCQVLDQTEGGDETTLHPADASSTVKTMKDLVVVAQSKNVTLPENEVFIVATVDPPAAASKPYTYEWRLISHPSEDTSEGTKEGQTTDKLHLTGLKQGSYVFQVWVKNADAIGTANATVTVFPANRTNLAPVAVISPPQQTVQLPTRSVVLDAGSSKDDDKIVSYAWELQKGPLQYTFNPAKNTNMTTLQIENLIPGNYTFKLTVEDSGHLTNSTTANITVIKETDYPPTAIAGKDMVVYLPVNEVTLNGNLSTDDKKIVDWEWKAVGENNKAVDMQDTHTPYLKLSHLQEGIYDYQLKVTDESGQSSTSVVHVFVKPGTGKPPEANAGMNQTVSLPQTWAIVDASASKSDAKIVKYTWSQISGPTNSTIIQKSDDPKANVTGLTKGEYQFQVEVEDDAKLTGISKVHVIIMQKINEPPVANAGEDQIVQLPQSVALLNGSLSKDDVKIAVWKWERMPESAAAGEIISSSDSSPILQLTNLVPGKYFFKLTVKDEQGLSSEDTAVLIVVENEQKQNLLEIITGVPITNLTQAEVDKFLQQMSLLLLPHDTHLVLDKIEDQINTESAILIIHGTNAKNETIDGYKLAIQLRQRLRQDVSLLQVPIVSIDTIMCLDTCSAHGTCNDSSTAGRQCVCDAFWMENFLKKKFGNGERNCDWSKIYVGIVVCLLLIMLFALVWSLLFLFRKNLSAFRSSYAAAPANPSANGSSRSSKRHAKRQYTLLDDEEIELEAHEDDEEYEDSDSDVLFESSTKSSARPKSNGTKMYPLPNGFHRNGILKHPRRVKT